METKIIICATCGKETAACYTDEGILGLTHGRCQCRECYIKDGHPECPNCKNLLQQGWSFCPHCGALRIK